MTTTERLSEICFGLQRGSEKSVMMTPVPFEVAFVLNNDGFVWH